MIKFAYTHTYIKTYPTEQPGHALANFSSQLTVVSPFHIIHPYSRPTPALSGFCLYTLNVHLWRCIHSRCATAARDVPPVLIPRTRKEHLLVDHNMPPDTLLCCRQALLSTRIFRPQVFSSTSTCLDDTRLARILWMCSMFSIFFPASRVISEGAAELFRI